MPKFTEKQAEEQFRIFSDNVKEEDIHDVLEKEEAINKKVHGPLDKFTQKIKLLFSIVKDYANGKYREIPWKTIAAITGTLIYVFVPFDILPDFIPVIGLTDDAAVIALCLAAIDSDLKKYEEWKKNQVEYEIIRESNNVKKHENDC
jgi:uncharacterized membrane protein YkvA (DUF1232 family)